LAVLLLYGDLRAPESIGKLFLPTEVALFNDKKTGLQFLTITTIRSYNLERELKKYTWIKKTRVWETKNV
jgi:hypothetical protein